MLKQAVTFLNGNKNIVKDEAITLYIENHNLPTNYLIQQPLQIQTQWLDIHYLYCDVPFGLFYLSNYGILYSTKLGRYIIPEITNNGYMRVRFIINGQRYRSSIHRAVMMLFNPVPNMENLQVNHIDGNKHNNCIMNLEWCTSKENIHHAANSGLRHPRKGETHPFAVLTEEIVHKICKMMQDGVRSCDIAKYLNISEDLIGNIRRKIVWMHISKDYTFEKLDNKLTEDEIHNVYRILIERGCNIDTYRYIATEVLNRDTGALQTVRNFAYGRKPMYKHIYELYKDKLVFNNK